LTFDAPPTDAQNFVNQFCERILYPGYDPFAAVDIAEPFTFAFHIELGDYGYYSYSPNVAESVLGNRCLFTRSGGQVQIRLDATNPDLYSVKLDKRFSCEAACHFVPLDIAHPIPDSPIAVLGVNETGGTYILEDGEVCVGFELWTVALREQWPMMLGGHAVIRLENEEIAELNISTDGTITHDNIENHANQGFKPYFHCFPANRREGPNDLTISISTSDGQELSYSWEFFVGSIETTLALS
jgi:hypothetical protein